MQGSDHLAESQTGAEHLHRVLDPGSLDPCGRGRGCWAGHGAGVYSGVEAVKAVAAEMMALEVAVGVAEEDDRR